MVKPIRMTATVRRGAAKRFMFGLLLGVGGSIIA
jgi:hypothetical protein